MMIFRRQRYRLYPNATQQADLARQFGACRFVWNMFLRLRVDAYAMSKGEAVDLEPREDDKPERRFRIEWLRANPGAKLGYHITAALLTKARQYPGLEWLRDVNCRTLQQVLRDLDIAYTNFFQKRGEFPQFKRKRAARTYRAPEAPKVWEKAIRFPKVSDVRAIVHRQIDGDPKSTTVIRDAAGRYFASVLYEVNAPALQHAPGSHVGIDLGLTHFAVLSTGEKVENPRWLRKAEKRLARLQRKVSRRQKGSSGREKARRVVARQHARVADTRKDFLDKLSRRLVDENQVISIEDLSVKGMSRGRLSKSVHDAGWGTFIRMLEYKADWYGCEIRKVDRFFPSSKRCHRCGFTLAVLPLSARRWTCPECRTEHDRDVNAAMNIKLFSTGGSPGIHAGGETGYGLVEAGSSEA